MSPFDDRAAPDELERENARKLISNLSSSLLGLSSRARVCVSF